jgi:REP element-mobilizing transposase RayT
MREHIRRSHNVSALLSHLVCPVKYRRAVFSGEMDTALRGICLEIAERYEIRFLEIGTDQDPVHFLVQTIPPDSPTKLVRVIKSLTAREVFRRGPAVKKYLWGGEVWADGYYISTGGRHGSEGEVQRYIATQGRQKEYVKLHTQQLRLF